MVSDKPSLAHYGCAVGLLFSDGLGLGNGCVGPFPGHPQLLLPLAESSRIQSCHPHQLLSYLIQPLGACSSFQEIAYAYTFPLYFPGLF